MQALDDTIAALGRPVFLRALGAGAAIARWRHDGGIVTVAPSTTVRLAMSLVERRNAHDRSQGTAAGRASVSIFSPREGASVEVRGAADVVQLFLEEESLDAPFACPPMVHLDDEALRSLVMRIIVGSARGGPDDALGTETDLHALTLRIGRHVGGSPRGPFRGGLAPAASRRVEAMIEAALDEAGSPTLADLAGAAGLSITHFVRAFRHDTGDTPHRYLVRRRLERAIALLRLAHNPIAEVADAMGFATPAHFVATFRAEMGVTPGAVRDALAG